MLIPEFVGIYRNCRLEITCKDGYYFHKMGMINYSFPPCTKLVFNEKLINYLKWKYLITVLVTDYVCKNTYEFVLKTDKYEIEEFPRKIRNRIRKSLQNCTFKRPELSDLLSTGLEINRSTLKRQNRRDRYLSDLNNWKKYITFLYTHENIFMMAAYHGNRMVGYIVSAKIEDKFCIQHAFIDKHESDITAPMNGLIFTMVNMLIKENGLIKVSYGLDSIKDLPELNRFKSNMLFEKEPLTRVYIINPIILPFFKMTVFILIRVLKRKKIRNRIVRELFHIYYGHRLLEKTLNKEKTLRQNINI